MSIEDPRLSSIDNTSAADDFDSAVEQHLGFNGEAADGIEVAQAETPEAGRTDRLPAPTPSVQTAAAAIPAEVTPNADNIVTLPAGIELDNLEFQVDGENLVLILADGTEIVVIGGAANIPTFVIGDVELPQVALFAALEGSNINIAAGPDGTFTAQGTPDGNRNFEDDPIGDGFEEFALADLLGDTDFGDEQNAAPTFGGDGTPSILEPLTASFIYDEAVIADSDATNQIITGTLPFEQGPDFGTISRVNFTGASNADEEGLGAQILPGFTSGGRAITVTSFPAPAAGADLDFLAIEGVDSDGNLVFTLTITNRETGAFEFEMVGKLDHPDAGADGAQDDLNDLLRLSFTYTVTDLDGDSVTGLFDIDVMDDAPSFGEADAGAVDEDYLYNGNNDEDDQGDDDIDDLPPKEQLVQLLEVPGPSDGTVTSGSLGINWGADNGNAGDNSGLTGDADDRGVAFTQATLDALNAKGLKSDGVTLKYAMSTDGTAIVAYKPYKDDGEGPVPQRVSETSEEQPGNWPEYSGEEVFVVSVSDIAANGTYQFELIGNLDHPDKTAEDDLAIKFLFTAQDSDGDTASSSFTVTVNDDSPVANTNPLIQLDDDALAGGNAGGPGDDIETAVLTGILGHEAGADGVASILWASNGIEVPYGFWFQLSDDGKTMTITQNQGVSEDNYVAVFKAVITDTQTGAYEITQLAPVKHAGTIPGAEDNTPTIGFQYIVTDGDGDAVRGNVSFNIDDDTPTVGENALIQLDDDALAGGNAGGPEDAVQTTLLSGILAHSGGADGTASVLWAPNGISVPYGFWFEISDDMKTMTITQNQGETEDNYVPVFKAVITDPSTGAYEVTQLAPVMHDASGTEDNEQISFEYRVTDGDGDVATGSITINVDDDTPVASNVVVSRQLDDEGQPNGNPGAGLLFAGSDAPGQDVTATGGAGTLFKAGADGLKSVSVVAPIFAVVYTDAEGFARTEQVAWDEGEPGEGGSTVFTATSAHYEGGAAVLTIGADGSYSLTMNAPIAHPEQNPLVSGSENDKTLRFEFTVVDGDGDTANGSLTVKVDDDTPSPLLNVVKAATLDDEAQVVFTPVNTGGSRDVDPDLKTVSGGPGTLFKIGADGLSDLSVELPSLVVLAKAGNGFAVPEIVEWSEGVRSEGGVTTFTATIGSGDATKVVAELIIRADGSYEFTLDAPLAHSVSSTREDNSDLVFTYVVTDGDGDKAAGALVISVDDDTPIANIEVGASVTLDDDVQSLFAGNNTPDDGVTNNSVATGEKDALFSAGADGVQVVTISGGAFEVIYKQGGLALTEAVIWGEGTKSADGTTTFIAKGATSNQEAAELKINADGSYSFELKAPVVHSGVGEINDNKTISIGFEVVDGDGDKAGGQLYISVNDDAPVASNVEVSRQLDDEGQPNGNPGAGLLFAGSDAPGQDVTATGGAGTLFKAGADGLKSVSVVAPIFAVVYTDAEGFARTEQVAWDEGEPGEGGSTVFTATSAHYEGGAAVLTIGADGSYSLTMNAPIAHPEQNPLVSGSENDKTLRFEFTVVDGDGDTANGSLTVKVDDDTPTPLLNGVQTATLDDEAQGLFPGNPGGVSGDVSSDIKTVSGGEGALFKMGADGLSDLSVELPPLVVLAKASNGFAVPEIVEWSEGVRSAGGETTFTAMIGSGDASKVVAELVIRADGSYEFTLDAPLAHSVSSTREDNSDLVFTYVVTDGDGDKAAGALVISVDDDTPIANVKVGATVALEDGGLSEASNAVGDPGALFNAGADGVKSVSISGGAFAAIFIQDGLAVSEMVEWGNGVTSANGATTFIAKGETISQDAAMLTIFADGSYSFELLAPVAENKMGNYKTIKFDFEVIDGDGDTDKGSLHIKVENMEAPEVASRMFNADDAETFLLDFGGDDMAPIFISDETDSLMVFGTDGDDFLHGGMGQVVMTGGAGADTFVFDATALDKFDVADVITDFNSEDGDVLDVTALLDSLLGEQATAETAASHLRSTVADGNTTVSVQTGQDTWTDVVVLNNHDTAVKVLFDDKHAAVTLD